ncbi:hypothetical protein [Priestia aryabhattai]|uniref:hypothetical protein n=1 Tax=Priestia aryabhattai TaxID=412384 RepID=UPI002E239E8E|nr:hypothetical protein [Priestia aryabhattai]
MINTIINVIFLIVFIAAAVSVTYEYRIMKKRGTANRVQFIFYVSAMIIYVGLAITALLSLFQ